MHHPHKRPVWKEMQFLFGLAQVLPPTARSQALDPGLALCSLGMSSKRAYHTGENQDALVIAVVAVVCTTSTMHSESAYIRRHEIHPFGLTSPPLPSSPIILLNLPYLPPLQ